MLAEYAYGEKPLRAGGWRRGGIALGSCDIVGLVQCVIDCVPNVNSDVAILAHSRFLNVKPELSPPTNPQRSWTVAEKFFLGRVVVRTKVNTLLAYLPVLFHQPLEPSSNLCGVFTPLKLHLSMRLACSGDPNLRLPGGVW